MWKLKLKETTSKPNRILIYRYIMSLRRDLTTGLIVTVMLFILVTRMEVARHP